MPVVKDQIRRIISEKQLKQRHECLCPAQGQFQRHPKGTHGGRTGCLP